MEKRKFFIIYILFLNFTLFGQNEIKFVTIDKEYIDSKSSYDEFEKHYFKLVDLKKSNYKFHFRLLIDKRKVIDLFSQDSINFDGQLLNYATEYDTIKEDKRELPEIPNKSEIPNKYVYEIIKLDSDTSNKIARKILEINPMEISEIPKSQYACGKMYFIIKSDSKISERAFICPLHGIVQDFYNFIEYDLKMMDRFYDFSDKFEKGKFYTYDYVNVYVRTDEERNRWKKEEFICITHIGASDKPLYPIIISKDSIYGDGISYEIEGKSYHRYNARKYIVNEKTYDKLKSQLLKYRKSGEYNYKDYELYIYAKGNPNHTYFLKYKESMKLLKLLIKISKTEPNNDSIIDAFEGALAYYKDFY